MVTLRTVAAALAVPALLLVSASVPARGTSDAEVVLAARTCSYPAQAINLANWKLTLPTGPAKNATTIAQPQLATYRSSPYFVAATNCDGVQFQAPVNGSTTSGSSYPRSELREMTNNGRDEASWSSSVGTHRIAVTEAFSALPKKKQQLVGLQIHDSLDDIATFRLSGTKLYITNGDNASFFLVTDNYKLGTRFTAGFEVSGDMVKAFYNNQQVVSFPATFTGGYFKAGAYTQSNCTTEGLTPSQCSGAGSNYGRVNVYGISVTHTVTAAQRLAGALRGMLGMS